MIRLNLLPEKETEEIRKYRKIQGIAKATMYCLTSIIKERMTEEEIADAAVKSLAFKGISSSWYHNVLALVQVGARTTESISGMDYLPCHTAVERNDVVTVDLSPEMDGYWGDFARSFVVFDGKVLSSISNDSPKEANELYHGISVIRALHDVFRDIAEPGTTFERLFDEIDSVIGLMSCTNLDFRGNFGHTIEKDLDSRLFIEKGNKAKL